MLKLSLPSRLRRHAGRLAGLVLASIVGGSVYAASAPPEQHAAASINEYQLEMKLELTTDAAHASHAERMTVALCMAPGKSGTVTTHGWKLDATPTPEGDNRLRIDLAVAAADGKAVVRTRLHGVPGESVHAEGKGMDGQHWYAIDMTALAGCSARTAMADTGARLLLVSESVQNASARAVAVSVAAKAGLTLLNPELLDERLISLNFDQVPAERAVQLVADIDGKKAVFEGRRVHFELK